MAPHVVIIPTEGLCNRLRGMASAHVLAKFYGTICFTLWFPEEACNCTFQDLFKNDLSEINLAEVTTRTYMYKPGEHTNTLLARFPYSDSEYIIVRGGHEFKHPDMPAEDFVRQKCEFYASLRVSYRVEQALLRHPSIIRGTVAVHFRDYVKKFDEADGRLFSEVSPLQDFVQIVRLIRTKHPERPVLICSNTPRAHEAFKALGNIIYRPDAERSRDSTDGMVDALVDVLAMSRCDVVIGTTMSSFSDEACFFRGIPKLCMGRERVDNYHCYGLSTVHGQHFLLGNLRIIRDLFG